MIIFNFSNEEIKSKEDFMEKIQLTREYHILKDRNKIEHLRYK